MLTLEEDRQGESLFRQWPQSPNSMCGSSAKPRRQTEAHDYPPAFLRRTTGLRRERVRPGGRRAIWADVCSAGEGEQWNWGRVGRRSTVEGALRGEGALRRKDSQGVTASQNVVFIQQTFVSAYCVPSNKCFSYSPCPQKPVLKEDTGN